MTAPFHNSFINRLDPLVPQQLSVALLQVYLHKPALEIKHAGDIYADLLFVGTDVIVATENNSLYELSATNGQTVWRTELGTPVDGSILPSGDIHPSGIMPGHLKPLHLLPT